MKQLFGLPAHPLLVHVPIVLLPLVAVFSILMVARPSLRRTLAWPSVVLGVLGAVEAILAASAGEALEKHLVAKEGADVLKELHEHSEAGEWARNWAIVFALVLVVFVVVPWWKQRSGARTLPKIASTILSVLLVLSGLASVASIVRAGHSGARVVWCEDADPPCEP